jgi:hypothetical protein
MTRTRKDGSKAWFPKTLKEVGHGQEESEEGEKVREKEEKESGRTKSKGKVGKENGKEDRRREEIRGQEGGREKTPEEHSQTRCSRGGSSRDRGRGACSLHCGNAGSENRSEPRGSLAFSDRLEALVGFE